MATVLVKNLPAVTEVDADDLLIVNVGGSGEFTTSNITFSDLKSNINKGGQVFTGDVEVNGSVTIVDPSGNSKFVGELDGNITGTAEFVNDLTGHYTSEISEAPDGPYYLQSSERQEIVDLRAEVDNRVNDQELATKLTEYAPIVAPNFQEAGDGTRPRYAGSPLINQVVLESSYLPTKADVAGADVPAINSFNYLTAGQTNNQHFDALDVALATKANNTHEANSTLVIVNGNTLGQNIDLLDAKTADFAINIHSAGSTNFITDGNTLGQNIDALDAQLGITANLAATALQPAALSDYETAADAAAKYAPISVTGAEGVAAKAVTDAIGALGDLAAADAGTLTTADDIKAALDLIINKVNAIINA